MKKLLLKVFAWVAWYWTPDEYTINRLTEILMSVLRRAGWSSYVYSIAKDAQVSIGMRIAATKELLEIISTVTGRSFVREVVLFLIENRSDLVPEDKRDLLFRNFESGLFDLTIDEAFMVLKKGGQEYHAEIIQRVIEGKFEVLSRDDLKEIIRLTALTAPQDHGKNQIEILGRKLIMDYNWSDDEKPALYQFIGEYVSHMTPRRVMVSVDQEE